MFFTTAVGIFETDKQILSCGYLFLRTSIKYFTNLVSYDYTTYSFEIFEPRKNGPTMVEVPGRRNDIKSLHPNQEFNLYLYNQQRALTVLTVTDVAVGQCKVQSDDVVLSEFVF